MLYFLLILLSIVWGGSFLFIKILLEAFGPWGITFMRCFMGFIILVIIIFIKKNSISFQQIPWIKLILIGLVNCAIPWTLIGYSETIISSGLASVLNASTPIWTVILGILFFHSKSNLLQWLGVFTAFIGILVLIDVDWNTFSVGNPLGIGAMILTAMCYGVAAHLSKKYLQSVSAYIIACVTLASSAALSGIGMLLTERDITHWNKWIEFDIYMSVIGLGIFGSGIAYILYYTILQRGSAEFVTLVTYLVPPFALFWGFLLLDETIYWTLILGMLCIFVGVYMAGRGKHKVKMREEKS